MTVHDVIDFWFEGDPNVFRKGRWFRGTEQLDKLMTDRFAATLNLATSGLFDSWAATAEGALALVIVLDQFSRNIHRGTPRAYAADRQARQVTTAAIAAFHDRRLTPVQRVFLYLPFEHSEDLEDQDRSARLFNLLSAEPALGDCIVEAYEHRSVIAQFGRFPFRNAILGRVSSAAELGYMASKGG